MVFKKIIDSNLIFGIIVTIFILSSAVATSCRGGKDLKVGLFGVEQILQKKSPYENPLDPNRALFNYAPSSAILQYPFLLKSKMIAPFQFENITPSILAWYGFEVLSLLISALILLRLIPSKSKETSLRNLKISFLMSIPLIGYELANGQNKLLALLFILIAVFLFEKNRMFLSAISFCLALTVYIPLLAFIFYFILRSKGKFIFSFIVAVFVVFLLVPSFIFGIRFNLFLLKEWFMRSLKPFLFTNTYATYIDLRGSSQSLPSAIGRIFVSGHTGAFVYLISPSLVHIIIKAFSSLILLFSCLAVWKSSKIISRGLCYAIFLTLALLLPKYCIFYTWSWLFALYFMVFNYISYPDVPVFKKRILLTLTCILLISSYLLGIHLLNHFSVLFWATLFLWGAMTGVLIQE